MFFIYQHKNKHSQGYISLSAMLFILTFYLKINLNENRFQLEVKYYFCVSCFIFSKYVKVAPVVGE